MSGISDVFMHLRVASGYSLQYGASHPSALVTRAAELGMSHLALTDRDGMYGSVRFAKACLAAGITPIIGVDLAVELNPARAGAHSARIPTAAKGGQLRDPRLPRVTVLARSRAGWAALCRLVTATHLSGQRGTPISSVELIGRYAAGGELSVLLGCDSELGWAVASRHRDEAEAELARWASAIPAGRLVIAATDQLVADGIGSTRQAAGLVSLADAHRLTAVLTNNVRMVHREQAATCDVLDAARRLVPLDVRNIDRRNAEGWLKPGSLMRPIADRVAEMAGRGPGGGERLIADTRELGLACGLDPRADIGLGEVHLPEFETLGTSAAQAMGVLRARCAAGVASRYGTLTSQVRIRLDEELATIDQLGFASYFLTVADVVALIRTMGVRCAARGSGAGSLVNYLLGISGVDPLAHGLIMERFMSPLRQALPDIDVDVESARRTEIYEKVLATFGGERVACVAMIDTYRVRHAVRDVGAALSLPPAEIDAMAKAFPHIRARDARAALRDLPELRAAGLDARSFDGHNPDVLFDLVESLDGLPRHLALHPCGVILSDRTLGDRTPLEASFGGFPMSQFDKDDVEDMGLLKLDILGVRMQSAMAHCLGEIGRSCGEEAVPDIDALAPFDDPQTYDMIDHAQTLGCFQIESPGQRELVGKFGPSTFEDLIVDISLFRPGPVKSDMVVPFLDARQGWSPPRYLHPSLREVLAETYGVVVFHEQIIKIIATVTGCSYAQADEARRALGDLEGQAQTKQWFIPLARQCGYDARTTDRIWQVLESFASFGFCKAHAAAFALPTYQSAWLKRHYPAHFLAGVLTHDPGMYPKRLLVEEARRMNIAVLGVDVNASTGTYRVEPVPMADDVAPEIPAGLPDGSGWGIRLSLADVKGITQDDVVRIEAGAPYQSLSDFWNRALVSAPVVENLILVGAFDSIYGIHVDTLAAALIRSGGSSRPRSGQVTRRDLLLTLADLARQARVEARTASRARGLRRQSTGQPAGTDPRELAARQARGQVVPAHIRDGFAGVQLALDLDPPAVDDVLSDGLAADPLVPGESAAGGPHGYRVAPMDVVPSGLPEMDARQRLAAELDILGLDVSHHVVDFYRDFLNVLGTVPAVDLLGQRNRASLLVAGVKVATQTPPVRSGRRVVFLTLDDGTGPADATFFEDAQGPYAATVFSSWLLVVRGELRRTGPRGVSLRATGAWDLQGLYQIWQDKLTEGQSREDALAAVIAVIQTVPQGFFPMVGEPLAVDTSRQADTEHAGAAGGMGRRRVLVHPSGFKQSPYADVQPAGVPAGEAPRKLWHSSQGSSGY